MFTFKAYRQGLLFAVLYCCLQLLGLPTNATDSLTTKRALVNYIHFPVLLFNYEEGAPSFSIPFNRVGNLILIKANADSTEGSFVLDTGCQGLVLNKTYFRHYPVTTDHALETKGITGTSSGGTEEALVRKFGFGSMQQYNVKANLANLGAIENSKGVKIFGLIGVQFLTDCELIIDLEENLLHFYPISKKERKTYRHAMLKDTAAYHTLPFDLVDNRIIVKTTMAGKKLRFIIDCAAETNILDSRLPDKIFDNFSITGKINLVGVGNKKVEALKGNLESFTMGGFTINNMPALITNLEKTCFSYGGCVDGILGLDNLSVQKIGFNFAINKMYIWK